MELLRATGITKSYGGLKVLKGIDFTIAEKEVISIVGASGAGKSTLLHILGLLDTPDSGEVKLKSYDTRSLNANQKAKLRNKEIGFVFQFHNLLPEFTALENICIPGYIAGDDINIVQRRGQELLDQLGLVDRSDHKPSELSGGEQQRVAVARALLNNPAIVFADEPSGNLDSKNAKELHEIFFSLRDSSNQTFVIVTHNEELANMADRKMEIVDGQIMQ